MSDSTRKVHVDHLVGLNYDVVAEMLSHMDIGSTEKLSAEVLAADDIANKYAYVHQACDDRKSVVKYLSKHFGDGVSLLEAMSKYGMYISGSRSLEYFNAGCVENDSDWDFYVSSWPTDIVGAMRELEKLGVVWVTPEQELVELKEQRCALMPMTRAKFAHLFMDADKVASEAEEYEVFTSIPHDGTVIVTYEDGRTKYEVNEPNDGYGTEKFILLVKGHLKYKGNTTRVQLIVEQRDDIKASIVSPFTYHSSCVQSYIGPYTACHMYGALTSEGKSYAWRNNISKKNERALCKFRPFAEVETDVVPGWSKYTKRGFKFEYPPEWNLGFELRTSQDSESTYVEYFDHTEAPHDVIALYRQTSAALSWYQVAYGTIAVHFPVKATYGYDLLDYEDWFDKSQYVSGEVRKYMNEYIPYVRYHNNGRMCTVFPHMRF